MNIQIKYSKASKKFLEKNPDNIQEKEVDQLILLAIKKIFKMEEISMDIKSLKGQEKDSFRIRKGDIRILFSIDKNNEVKEKRISADIESQSQLLSRERAILLLIFFGYVFGIARRYF